LSEQSGVIRLSRRQVEFLITLTGESDPTLAMKLFAKAMVAEGVSPKEMPEYITRLMNKNKPQGSTD